MKLGILTFHSVDNYGAVLQAFALQMYLKTLGHDVEIIDYRPSCFHPKRRLSLIHPVRLLGEMAGLYHARKFESFRKVHLNRTAACFTVADLESKLPRYDAVIVGSDQVWSPNVDRRKETDPIYFFRWNLPEGTKKIGYAASFGTDSIPEEHVPSVVDGLKNIDVISVREKSGVEIVRSLVEREATWVCDPVFLLSPEQWKAAAGVIGDKTRDYFTYMSPSIPMLQELARKHYCKVITPSWNPYFVVKSRLCISLDSPFSWIRHISSTQGFITKSFHGTSFAILMHAPFVFIRPAGQMAKRATRIINVLERVGLTSRILSEEDATSDCIDSILSAPIDWAKVDAAREEYVEVSKLFVSECIR